MLGTVHTLKSSVYMAVHGCLFHSPPSQGGGLSVKQQKYNKLDLFESDDNFKFFI